MNTEGFVILMEIVLPAVLLVVVVGWLLSGCVPPWWFPFPEF